MQGHELPGQQKTGSGGTQLRKRLAYEFYNGSFDVILENAADFDTDENEDDGDADEEQLNQRRRRHKDALRRDMMTRPLEAVQEDQVVEYQEDDDDEQAAPAHGTGVGGKILDELGELQEDEDHDEVLVLPNDETIIEEDEEGDEPDTFEDENALPTFEQ